MADDPFAAADDATPAADDFVAPEARADDDFFGAAEPPAAEGAFGAEPEPAPVEEPAPEPLEESGGSSAFDAQAAPEPAEESGGSYAFDAAPPPEPAEASGDSYAFDAQADRAPEPDPFLEADDGPHAVAQRAFDETVAARAAKEAALTKERRETAERDLDTFYDGITDKKAQKQAANRDHDDELKAKLEQPAPPNPFAKVVDLIGGAQADRDNEATSIMRRLLVRLKNDLKMETSA